MWSSRRSAPVRRAAAVALMSLALAACGFHLRGSGGGYALPPALSQLRVVSAGSAANDPLAQEVRDVLVQAGARLVEDAGAPALVLLGEEIASRVASVDTTTGKASEYILQYAAGFRLDGPSALPAQTVRLQADYAFDPAQVLAREQEEREVVRVMRRDAAQQIVRRVIRTLARTARQSGSRSGDPRE